MLGDALSYPRNSSDWIPTILIGGILMGILLGINIVSSLVPLLWILAFVPYLLFGAIVLGYGARVMKSAAELEDALPSFVDWGSLVADGLRLTLVGFAYSLLVVVPFLLFSLAVGVSYSTADPATGGTLALGLVTLVGLGAIGLLALAVSYVTPAAYANFAVEGSLGAAFDLSTILSAVTTLDYLKAWLLAVILSLVVGVIGLALSVVIVGVFVLFYVAVVSYYLLGRGFAAGLEGNRRSTVGPEF